MTFKRLALVSLAFALACGGSTESTTTTTTPEPATETMPEPAVEPASSNSSGIRTRTEDEIPTPPAAWEDMTAQAKGQYMAQEVLPYMRTLFQEYDAERYADFGCETCHGSEMSSRAFAMPNPDILPLHDTGTPEQQAMVQEHPRMVRFMFNHVVPAMRQMVGGEPYDAETGEGFGCYDCHTHAE